VWQFATLSFLLIKRQKDGARTLMREKMKRAIMIVSESGFPKEIRYFNLRRFLYAEFFWRESKVYI